MRLLTSLLSSLALSDASAQPRGPLALLLIVVSTVGAVLLCAVLVWGVMRLMPPEDHRDRPRGSDGSPPPWARYRADERPPLRTWLRWGGILAGAMIAAILMNDLPGWSAGLLGLEDVPALGDGPRRAVSIVLLPVLAVLLPKALATGEWNPTRWGSPRSRRGPVHTSDVAMLSLAALVMVGLALAGPRPYLTDGDLLGHVRRVPLYHLLVAVAFWVKGTLA